LLYWYKSTNTDAEWASTRYSVYLLYWYKSTNTDAESASTRYSVYLLYWYKSTNTDAVGVNKSTYVQRGKIQAISANDNRKGAFSVPTAAPGDEEEVGVVFSGVSQVLSLLALLVQKYKY
jgi:hypothetical protein